MCACHHYPLFQILIKTVKLPDWCSPGVISDSLYLNQSHRNYFNSESKWTYTSTLIFIYVQTFNNVLFYKYSSRHKAKLLLLYVSVPICMLLYLCAYMSVSMPMSILISMFFLQKIYSVSLDNVSKKDTNVNEKVKKQ